MKLSLRIEERTLLKSELKNLLIYINDYMVIGNYKGTPYWDADKAKLLEIKKDLVEGLLNKLVKMEKRNEKNEKSWGGNSGPL
jgi:hypothetical protein